MSQAMKQTDFVHLHVHSMYSLLDGANRIADMCGLVETTGMQALAITDHGNMFGAVEFFKTARKHGIKPIIGCEVYVAPGSRFEKKTARISESNHHLTLLVEDERGYRNLCKLVSSAYLEGFYYKPRVDKDLLREHNAGLIAMSACLAGEIPNLVLRGDMIGARKAAREYSEIFNDNRFFIELMKNGLEEQEKANVGLLEIAEELGIPIVATNDAHYLKKSDARAHDALLCIQAGKVLTDEKRMRFGTDEFYLKPPEEMIELFADYPDAIRNTVEIADRCNFEFRFDEYHFPKFEIPNGKTPNSYLDELAQKGLRSRFETMGGGIDEEKRARYEKRFDEEMGIIKSSQFAGYFLIVSDFIRYAKDRNIPVGPGRGSAAGSLVAYALGITDIDPMKYDLLFERFLNPERVSMPDIDVDFCIEGRDEVIRYVTEKYGGSGYVSQIITFGTMQAKAAIRDVGRVMGMTYGDVDRIAKMVPATLNIKIDEAVEQEPRLAELIKTDVRTRELINTAKTLEGITRHASTHAAGVVISNMPLDEYCPLYKDQKDNIVTQYSMKSLSKIGLIKFDFLGLRTLTLIDNAIKMIHASSDPDFDIRTIALDDKDTFALLCRGETNGVFQVEGSGIRDVMTKLQPETFKDLIALNALYRPGPLRSKMVDNFIDRRHGKVKIKYALPALKSILEDTYGVIVYQEQVMKIASELANFSLGDADRLRRAMSKKDPDEMAAHQEAFIAGAIKNKIPRKKAERIFDLMAQFAEYGFNKSHSAAYALIAYQTAYLKTHFPREFMAALLTSEIGNTDKILRYCSECRDMGIDMLPPDLNQSGLAFKVCGEALRYGLGAVKNVGTSAIEGILEVREDGDFLSLGEFCNRVDLRKVNKRVVESLVKCGVFDFTGAHRAQLLEAVDGCIDMAASRQRDRIAGQTSMFDAFQEGEGVSSEVYSLPDMPLWSDEEKLFHEKEVLGFYLSGHPLSRFAEELKLYSTSDTSTLKESTNGTEIRIAGVVSDRKEILTKKGTRMAFLSLEDLQGTVEVVVFSELYQKCITFVEGDAPIMVAGSVKVEEEQVKVMATNIYPLESAADVLTKRVHLLASADRFNEKQMQALKDILKRHPGKCLVYLHIQVPELSEAVLELPEDLMVTPSKEVREKICGLLGENAFKTREAN